MDVIVGAIRRKEMADAMEYDGVPGETLVMLVEERPLPGLGHRAASALGVLALVSETRRHRPRDYRAPGLCLIVSKLLQEPLQ